MKIKLNLNRGQEKLEAKRQLASRGHILLIDDEPENLDGLEALLTGEGYQVTATVSPHEALKAVTDGQIDLIISDQRMPTMLGTELLSAIKQQREDNIRVILTGHTDMNDLIHCINHGLLYRYLVKPWSSEVVLEVVREGMKKIKIERATQRLIPKALWNRLYEGRLEETQAGDGEKVQCAAALVSIREITRLTGLLNPSEVFTLLSQVMSAVERCAADNHGLLIQYARDSVILLFERTDHLVADSIQCAHHIEERLKSLNEKTLSQRITLSIGLHFGDALLGALGDQQRLELTLLGDIFQVASQFESIARSSDLPNDACDWLATQSFVDQAQSQEWEPINPLTHNNKTSVFSVFRAVK